MIRVRRAPTGWELEMTGHAGSAPAGQDLVCAGASMLALTLVRRLQELEFDDQVQMQLLYMNPGHVHLKAAPEKESEQRLQEVFDTVTAGLCLLGKSYPGCVSVQWSAEPLS